MDADEPNTCTRCTSSALYAFRYANALYVQRHTHMDPSHSPESRIQAHILAHQSLARQLHTFSGPLSGTTQVSRNQKGKTNLDFTEARDSECQWHQLGHMQVCTSLQTDITTPAPHHSVFLQAGCPSCQQRQSADWTNTGISAFQHPSSLLPTQTVFSFGPFLV